MSEDFCHYEGECIHGYGVEEWYHEHYSMYSSSKDHSYYKTECPECSHSIILMKR